MQSNRENQLDTHLMKLSRSIETLEQSEEETQRLTGETIQGDASPRGNYAIAVTFKDPVKVVSLYKEFMSIKRLSKNLQIA